MTLLWLSELYSVQRTKEYSPLLIGKDYVFNTCMLKELIIFRWVLIQAFTVIIEQVVTSEMVLLLIIYCFTMYLYNPFLCNLQG